ncbi:MAG: hypothetical protein LW742_04825 [Sphingomonadales bacterium]|jgi:hypothetical protein|nr:hypothetical protein [Sphingorhabdus sp.]MCE2829084.1 hypothetical protein [Sphingomonadales bacterium]
MHPQLASAAEEPPRHNRATPIVATVEVIEMAKVSFQRVPSAATAVHPQMRNAPRQGQIVRTCADIGTDQRCLLVTFE